MDPLQQARELMRQAQEQVREQAKDLAQQAKQRGESYVFTADDNTLLSQIAAEAGPAHAAKFQAAARNIIKQVKGFAAFAEATEALTTSSESAAIAEAGADVGDKAGLGGVQGSALLAAAAKLSGKVEHDTILPLPSMSLNLNKAINEKINKAMASAEFQGSMQDNPTFKSSPTFSALEKANMVNDLAEALVEAYLTDPVAAECMTTNKVNIAGCHDCFVLLTTVAQTGIGLCNAIATWNIFLADAAVQAEAMSLCSSGWGGDAGFQIENVGAALAGMITSHCLMAAF